MSHSIKESLELVSFLKNLALTIESSMKDGKVDLFDAVSAIQLAPSLIAAVNGIDLIKDELKDLDSKEKDMLLQEFKDAIFLFVRAIKAGRK